MYVASSCKKKLRNIFDRHVQCELGHLISIMGHYM